MHFNRLKNWVKWFTSVTDNFCHYSLYSRIIWYFSHNCVVSSCSDHLKEPLDAFLSEKFTFATRLYRMPSRSGLIRGRLKGSSMAETAVIIFLDAHIEVSDGWIEPLLYELTVNRLVLLAICYPSLLYCSSNRKLPNWMTLILFGAEKPQCPL